VQRDSVLEVNGLVNRRAIALKVIDDGVSVCGTGLVVDGRNLNDLLCRQLEQDLSNSFYLRENSLVLVTYE
jgi:hypothetical protein